MGNIIKYIISDFWEEHGDPGNKGYFWLDGGPWRTWMATIIYLYLVLKAGPEFMRNRKPYTMKLLIRFYNILLVVLNFYLFCFCLKTVNYGWDIINCERAVSLDRRDGLIFWGHQFFHLRYLEFFDTFFIVLRKKNSQITFLHVFHHGIVPTLMYIGIKFYPIPLNSLLPITNMFIHIIMYTYYGLATFGPGIQKYLWWKKYLTRIQIGQFVLLLASSLQPIFYIRSSRCNFPRGLVILNSCIALTFISLFVSFYRRTYGREELKKLEQKQCQQNNDTSLNGKCLHSNSSEIHSDNLGETSAKEKRD